MSIQDDYFDVSEHLKKNGPEWVSKAFERIWGWGVDCENRIWGWGVDYENENDQVTD